MRQPSIVTPVLKPAKQTAWTVSFVYDRQKQQDLAHSTPKPVLESTQSTRKELRVPSARKAQTSKGAVPVNSLPSTVNVSVENIHSRVVPSKKRKQEKEY